LGFRLYAITQRTKEIGVRKVLGASEGSLLLLLVERISCGWCC
jgi:ABC-type antimicrobial peptide transport system permease subunit